MNPISIYSFDLLSEYFHSERILLKIFESAVLNHNYDKIDIIVNIFHRYLCDIIDLSDSFSVVSDSDNSYELEFSKDELKHYILDANSKKKLKQMIRFNLSYDRNQPVFLKDYSSKYLYPNDSKYRFTYLFFKDGKEIIEFDSYLSIFFDYRYPFEIKEHHVKYQDVIDSNVFMN